jgi:hypothetical protein
MSVKIITKTVFSCHTLAYRYAYRMHTCTVRCGTVPYGKSANPSVSPSARFLQDTAWLDLWSVIKTFTDPQARSNIKRKNVSRSLLRISSWKSSTNEKFTFENGQFFSPPKISGDRRIRVFCLHFSDVLKTEKFENIKPARCFQSRLEALVDCV